MNNVRLNELSTRTHHTLRTCVPLLFLEYYLSSFKFFFLIYFALVFLILFYFYCRCYGGRQLTAVRYNSLRTRLWRPCMFCICKSFNQLKKWIFFLSLFFLPTWITMTSIWTVTYSRKQTMRVACRFKEFALIESTVVWWNCYDRATRLAIRRAINGSVKKKQKLPRRQGVIYFLFCVRHVWQWCTLSNNKNGT